MNVEGVKKQLSSSIRPYIDTVIETLFGNDHRSSIVFYVATLVYMLFLWTQNQTHSTDQFPGLVIIALIVFSLAGIGEELFRWKVLEPRAEETGDEDESAGLEDLASEEGVGSDEITEVTERDTSVELGKFTFALLTLVLYMLIIQVLGFYAATTAFTFTFMYATSKNLKYSLLGTGLLMAFLWIIFIELLEATLLLRFGILF